LRHKHAVLVVALLVLGGDFVGKGAMSLLQPFVMARRCPSTRSPCSS
jgi:hypothetical protein